MSRHGRRTSSWNSLSALGPVLRCAIILRGNSLCAWCGFSLTKEWTQIDHVVSRESGGASRPDNLVPSCCRCNGERESDLVTSWVTEQLSAPIDADLRTRARDLARSWYPWFEARELRNRERQAARDRRRRRRDENPLEEPPF